MCISRASSAPYWRHRNQISLAFLGPTSRAEEARAVAAVEGADLGADLPEARVVGGDREVADEVQDVAAADRVARDHRHDGLGQPADLQVQVGHVEAADGCAGRDVAGVASHPLIAAGAEGLVAFAREDDHADGRVLARFVHRVGDLDEGFRAERVVHFRAVDRDLCDAVAGQLVLDVLVVGGRSPVHGR